MATNKLLSSTKLIGVFFIMLVCALPANAQFLRTSYFMEGTHYRQQLNPALTPTKGYFNLPVVGAVNATVGSTSLGYQDIIDIENTSQKELTPKILEFVKRDYTVLYTDEWLGYNAVDKMFYHYSVDHGKGKYVDGRIYTNTIEGFWSIFKRGIIGIYHHISKKHLQLYANEFTFRYNTRKIRDSSKFKLLLRNSYFKITYLDIIAA